MTNPIYKLFVGKTTFFDLIFERTLSKDEATFANYNQRKTIDIGKKQYKG